MQIYAQQGLKFTFNGAVSLSPWYNSFSIKVEKYPIQARKRLKTVIRMATVVVIINGHGLGIVCVVDTNPIRVS